MQAHLSLLRRRRQTLRAADGDFYWLDDEDRPSVVGELVRLDGVDRLRELVEVEQEKAELREAFRAELLRPGGFHLSNGVTDHADRGVAARREVDPFRAEVVGVRSAVEVAEPLELAEQMVHGLFADPQPGREV